MPAQRKLGHATNQRKAILKNLVTSLFLNGKIETTEARATEVKNIAEKLIAIAIGEADNFTSKQIKISAARLDSGGRKITKSATSKNNRKYEVVEREEKTEMVTVDSPSRLHARRQIIKWIYRPKNADGKYIDIPGKILGEIASKYKNRNGGYLRIYKLGTRRGDAADMAIVEFV